MDYNFKAIENKWRKYWADNSVFEVKEDQSKEKFYVLDMFPYPSGAGLHVGHPLGYIASDIYSRYKKHKGYNVLHPMGYDSFGLPAEQYAIQTGQHPAKTTAQNIDRYRDQLEKMGFCYDWSREVRTSSPEYYKWTQWIFKQLFSSWYNKDTDKAESIDALIAEFEVNGNSKINAEHDCKLEFSSKEWCSFNKAKEEEILQAYRLAYLADSWVNWCPALGTVLANDEVVVGVSERGGHPVEQKKMRQWSMRIKAYAERMLTGLDGLEWADSIKEIQRNWIGKSVGASVNFAVKGHEEKIDVFTTRPDTIYGVSFMVLAPEHPFVEKFTTNDQAEGVKAYQKQASLKSERDRQSDVKNCTGQFTGAYALHPFTNEEIPIWIGDYVLASYGTGAVMAVPCGDQRDYDFAKTFEIEIKNIFEDIDISEKAHAEKTGNIANSNFLNGLNIKKAAKRAIHEIETRGIGKGKTNYRLRDAIFSRQRYWGEPFPVYYKNELPCLVSDENLPVTLPEVDKYLPTEAGDPPLARAEKADWEHFEGDRMEYNTMPGWAGSSWYFLRYLDPENQERFAAEEKINYWQNVDLYMGGAEHATGHLLYARFWTKFLYDLDLIPFDEPFKKMINQGMILGRSSFAYRLDNKYTGVKKNVFVSANYLNVDGKVEMTSELNEKLKEIGLIISDSVIEILPIHVDIAMVDQDKLDVEAFKNWRSDYAKAQFILDEKGQFQTGHEVEKMSKSKFNVQTPDELVEKFGADTLRMYEMFLGPVEQSKPWDTKGINGVHNFLRKLWKLSHDSENNFVVSDTRATKDAMKTLHKTIKKMEDDLERFSFNTGVSTLMICVNELQEQKCNNRHVIEQLVLLLSPYAPHLAEELWVKLGHDAGTVSSQEFPKLDESYLKETSHDYPVSFNGKMRFIATLDLALSPEDIKTEIISMEKTQKWLEGKDPKKIIVVPGKIVNIVL
jgi:leucyl-tRNA synthetase